MLLKKCKYLVTQNKKRDILEDVDVLIEGNTITNIGKNLKGSPVIDCSNRIVMPGLINAHTHLGMTSLRGISDDKELAPWLKEILAAEHELSRKEMEAGAYLGITEALRTGTTTIVDHYLPGDISVKPANDLGIRLFSMVGFSDVHKHGKTDIARALPKTTNVGLGPHAIYTTTEKLLKDLKRYADGHDMLLHIHVAETRKERVECKQQHGRLPIEYLESIGFLGENATLVHCIWLTKGELDLIAKRRAKVIHCPQSNMKLASGGTMPIREMQERGVTVALGTDSTASNNAMDMFREMHTAALLHRQHYWDANAVTAQEVLDLATVNGATTLHLDAGAIEKNRLADIVTLDLNDVNLLPIEKKSVVSHLVYAANGMNVAEVIVNGELLLKDKTFIPRQELP